MAILTPAIGGVLVSLCSSAYTGVYFLLPRVPSSFTFANGSRQIPALRQQFGMYTLVTASRPVVSLSRLTRLSVPQRHVTRQKILNWRQSLRFPARPRVSHEGVNLMEQLLCEPDDRLGTQASSSVSRPNSMIVQARRSGFIAPTGTTGSVDGVHLIKVDFQCILRYRHSRNLTFPSPTLGSSLVPRH